MTYFLTDEVLTLTCPRKKDGQSRCLRSFYSLRVVVRYFCAARGLAQNIAFDDAEEYAKRLRHLTSEIALTSEVKGHLIPCDWLEVGRLDGRPVAWLSGSEAGEACFPPCDLIEETIVGPLSNQDLAERYNFIRRDSRGMETYADKATGELTFLVRALPPDLHGSLWQRLWRRLVDVARGRSR